MKDNTVTVKFTVFLHRRRVILLDWDNFGSDVIVSIKMYVFASLQTVTTLRQNYFSKHLPQ